MGWIPTGGGGGTSLTTKGDLHGYDTTDKRIPVGSDGQVLTADSAQTLGVKWAAASGGAVPEWVEDLDTRPTSSHTDDDEFSSDTSADYTTFDASGSSTWTIDKDVLSVRFATQGSADLSGFVKAMTPSTPPVTIESAVRVLAPLQNHNMVGLSFSDGATTTSNTAHLLLFPNGSSQWQWQLRSGTFTNSATTDYSLTFAPSVAGIVYLRLIWSATNTFKIQMSPDGVTFDQFGQTTNSITLSPTHIGFVVSKWGGTAAAIGTFEYLRVSESDLST